MLREQDQRGYLHQYEYDGLIITVGHRDQVSSSCITLTLLTPLPVCKCAQFRHPSSREQTHLTTCLTSKSRISLCFSQNFSLTKTQTSLAPANPCSCYLNQNAGICTSTVPSTVKPRRRRIWGCEGSPSESAPYPTTAGGRAGESQSSRVCWSHLGGGTLHPSPEKHKNMGFIFLQFGGDLKENGKC